MSDILTKEELKKIDGYYRAANYLSCAQLYLKDNPLLTRPLQFSDIKSKLVGHWGTAPGQNLVYAHLNRIIKKNDLNVLYICGPGHGGQVLTSNTYLEGSYTHYYPEITQDINGMKRLCQQFSSPGGVGSHATPETPGSIHEGGELGYSLSHAFGAVLDNPDLLVACVIGDGEAETGPLAGSWFGNKILNHKKDGVVLPILHLNGYKIANPTILGRNTDEELDMYFKGSGWNPYHVSYESDNQIHQDLASTLDDIIIEINKIKEGDKSIKYPMLILRTPKGLSGPKKVNDKIIEDSFRAHQIPIEVKPGDNKSLKMLEEWLKSYKPQELFSKDGQLKSEYQSFIPDLKKTIGMNIYANGNKTNLVLPNIDSYAIEVADPGSVFVSDMTELGSYIRDIVKLNMDNFRIFGPDEALSNRLGHVFEDTNRQWNSTIIKNDEFLANDGRVIDSILSEHLCEGMLEGYILTGRYGFFHSYEAFARVIDSMVSQHSKWLKMALEIPWRESIPSLNIILTSHVWQQDHNGFTHQDPGFLNHVVNKKSRIVRTYLPADANTLIATFEKIIPSQDLINVIVASKHPRLQWLSMAQAKKHVENGVGIWDFASNDEGNPDLVMVSCGDTPTLEIIAAIRILNKYAPNLKIRMVNVVDLMCLQLDTRHPAGLNDELYNYIFTEDKPIVFAFHGYPNLIHELTYKRKNRNIHVRGYIEEGTITTPFDMRVLNKVDRYHLVMLALKHIKLEDNLEDDLSCYCEQMLLKHQDYIKEYGKDLDEIENWTFERGEDFAN